MLLNTAKFLAIAPRVVQPFSLLPSVLFRSMGGGPRPRFSESHKKSRRKTDDEDFYGSLEEAAVWKDKDNRVFRSAGGGRRRNSEQQTSSRKNYNISEDEYYVPSDGISSSSALKANKSLQSREGSSRRQPAAHRQRRERNNFPDDGLGPPDGVSSAVKRRDRGIPKPGQFLKKYLRQPLSSLPKNIMRSVPYIKEYIVKDWLRLYPKGGQLRRLQRDIAYRMDNSPGKLDHEHLLPIVATLLDEGAIELDTIRNGQGTVTIRPVQRSGRKR
mmetsp:Transcript_31775/g.46864  ORF Transcript_31775/g.46864 Transcript_31775/m.46864 type:complete len:272 (-) Transcript_31775:407-1222(-)